MAYYFYLGAFTLPITPSSLKITTPSQNKTVTLINEGEINILKTQGLREISFEFLLPHQKYPFINHNVLDYTADVLIPIINGIKETKQPFQFIVSRMTPKGDRFLFCTSITCQIEDFEYEEDAEDNGLDVMCNMVLKEWKSYGTTSTKIVENTDGTKTAEITTPRESTKTAPKTYVVQKGDTFVLIAKKQYGDFSKYKEIAKANGKSKLSEGLQPGTVLRLP